SLVHTTGQLFTDKAGVRQPGSDRPSMRPDEPDARNTLRDCGLFVGEARPRGTTALEHFQNAVEATFPPGRMSRVSISLKPKEAALLALRLQVPANSRRGDVLRLDLVQRAAGAKAIMGGLAIEIHVK